MGKGKDLERVVSTLEKHLSAHSQTVIESPKRLKDITTGRLREHDVVLTVSSDHHVFTVAIECRDRKRKVGVPDVESFWAKCSDTGVDKGIIVSSSGFTNSAIEKAIFRSIRCLTIDEVETFDWLCPDAVLVEHTKEYGMAIYTYVVDWTTNVLDFSDYLAFFEDGIEITDDVILNFIKQDLKNLLNDLPSVNNVISIRCNTKGCYLKHHGNDKKIPLNAIQLKIPFVNKIEEKSFTRRSYLDPNLEGSIAEIATAPVTIDGELKQFAIVSSEGRRSLQLLEDDKF
jgi:hypothetical protein